jgi:hypothetical protein
MKMVAEVIASAFSSGLSWRGSLAGKEIYCPPPGLKGHDIMSACEQYSTYRTNPDVAERAYEDAMAASLSRAFPCRAIGRLSGLPRPRRACSQSVSLILIPAFAAAFVAASTRLGASLRF